MKLPKIKTLNHQIGSQATGLPACTSVRHDARAESRGDSMPLLLRPLELRRAA